MRTLLHRWALVASLTFGGVARGWPSQGPDLKADPEVQAAIKLLEAQFEADRAQLEIPGLSAAVILDQEILWMRGFGNADVERRIPATPETVYRVGSITKLFTATMLMQLRDQGKLQLDDPLTKHLPELRRGRHVRELSRVTLRQLVSHTSGLPTEAPLDYWETLEFPTAAALLESLNDAELGAPGPRKYSNLGFALLGEALSRVAGQPYQVYVRERILNPLAMRNSGFDPAPAGRPRVATGYARYREGRARTIAPGADLGGLVPAGALYSTVQDLARFISLQFRDGPEPAGGAQVLRGGALREMHSVQGMNSDWRSGWGIGFGLERVADLVAAGHAGGINGFNTQILFLPAEKLGVAVFTNTNTEPHDFARKALELLVPVLERVRDRVSPADTAPAPAAWQRYVGMYEHTIGPDIEVRLIQNQLVLASPEAPQEPGDRLAPEGPHRFRLKDDSSRGELVTFELGAAGTAARVRVGPYVYDRKP